MAAERMILKPDDLYINIVHPEQDVLIRLTFNGAESFMGRSLAIQMTPQETLLFAASLQRTANLALSSKTPARKID